MAAAVLIPPSPNNHPIMSTNRRAPLSNIPHAANSPHRPLAPSGMKRPRQILQQENEPPLKKQLLERQAADAPGTPRRRLAPPTTAEGRVFETGSNNVPQNAFARRLVAARENKGIVRPSKVERLGVDHADAARPAASVRVTRAEKAAQENAENIRQWQKHYRRAFPTFVFYFESVPEETRNKFSRQIASLGAQEERFFSRHVTHVVTTRQIPADHEEPPADPQHGDGQVKTINPSLLDKSGAASARGNPGSTDVLSRAKEMGMKIWALEKLQRMIVTITNGPDGQTGIVKGHPAAGSTRSREDDLSQLLRRERINGPAERDPLAATKDMIHFKGPFILIRDMDEKTKPVMVREYPRVAKRQEGAWPQFRSAPIGKCPFLDDQATQREWDREAEREERERRKAAILKEHGQSQAPITRSVTAEAAKGDQAIGREQQTTLKEVENSQTRTRPLPENRKAAVASAGGDIERQLPPQDLKVQQPTFARPSPMFFSREPAASGINPSMMTSAIRSQMISSTAAAPGAKTGLSKEVHELKRKVLEKNNGSLSAGSIPSSYRMNDLAGHLKNARAPAPQRVAKSKAQEKLGGIKEEDHDSEDELASAQATTKTKKRVIKRDPKPGYCENCRDKFEDFDEHVISRKHRKFATTQSNWNELDSLLRVLQSC